MKKEKRATQEAQNETNLAKIFALIKKREELMLVDKTSPFNNTELRIISEIFVAKTSGARLISTQLAKRIGVTRSAISQMVASLEERGVLRRVASPIDKKIAYVEIADGALEQYGDALDETLIFLGELVEEFGEEKFDEMCALFHGFVGVLKKRIHEREKE